jgi:hypothetical protein
MELKLRYKNSVSRALYIYDNYELINKLLYDGLSLYDIEQIMNVEKYRLHMFFKNKPSVAIFGQKTEPYYSEEELLNSNFNFNFNDLSYDEQQIYLEREKTGLLGRYFTSVNGLHGGREA